MIMLANDSWLQFMCSCIGLGPNFSTSSGLGYVSQLMGSVRSGHTKWTNGQLCTGPVQHLTTFSAPCFEQKHTARQSQTADSAPGVAAWEVTLSTRKVVPCVRWPATGITAHSL